MEIYLAHAKGRAYFYQLNGAKYFQHWTYETYEEQQKNTLATSNKF